MRRPGATTRPALLLASVCLVFLLVLALVLLWPRGAPPPAIQGAVLPQPRPLPNFELMDHRGQRVQKADLNGQWHLVSYGYTHCPDICPTTLGELAAFRRLLNEAERFNDVRVLFYTIDPERDAVDRLAAYVPWFHSSFVGLRAPDDAAAQTFEQALGIRASVQPAENPSDYRVSHGLMLYLVDAAGRFRATLAPTRERDGRQHYQPQRLLEDYLALRAWADR